MTNRQTFTERRLAELPVPAAGRSLYHDAKSPLKLEVTPAGSRTFYLVRRVNGRVRRIRIGPWPTLRLEDARRIAQERAADIARGIDPLADARQQAQDRYSFAEALADYIAERKAKGVKQRTLDEYRRLVDTLLPTWASRPIRDIDKGSILTAHRRIGKENGPATANAVMRVVRAVLRFAVDLDRLTKSPAVVLKGRWFAEHARDTVIPPERIAEWRRAVDDLRNAPDRPAGLAVVADWLEFCLLTGLRRGEAARMRWADIDGGILTIADTKNSRPLRLPITEQMAAILDRRRRTSKGPWVFPTWRKSAAGHVVDCADALDSLEAATGLAVTHHDLRRTFVSIAAPLVPGPVLKSLINHKERKGNDVTQRHYVRLSAEQLRPHLEAVQREMTDAAPAPERPRMRLAV